MKRLPIVLLLLACWSTGYARQYIPNIKKSDPLNYQFGIEYIHTLADAKNDWGKLFKDNHQGANVYLGWHWNQYVMLEAGYSWTTRRAKNFDLANGGSAFGVTNTQDTRSRGQVRLKNTHFDINLFNPIKDDIKAIASIGVSFFRQHITVTTTPIGSTMQQTLDGVAGKTAAVLRLGLGLQYDVTKFWGLRGMYHYDQFSKSNVRNAPANPGSKVFNDGHTFSLGVWWRV